MNHAWPRDYGPISVKNQEGLLQFVSFNYSASEQTTLATIAQQENIFLNKLGHHFDGGNFMVSDDGTCAFIDSPSSQGPTAEVEQILPTEVGCQKVIRIPELSDMFTLSTGSNAGDIATGLNNKEISQHIDLVAKFLPGHTVIVATLNKLEAEAAAVATSTKEKSQDLARSQLTALQGYLDNIQAIFEKAGFTVNRVPLHVKRVATTSRMKEGTEWKDRQFEDVYTWFLYSMTNALLLGPKAAIVPIYDTFFPNKVGKEEVEKHVREIYAVSGYENVTFISADHLATLGGAWHCAAMQIPAGDFMPASCAPPAQTQPLGNNGRPQRALP